MYKNHELNIEKRAKWFECYIAINGIIHRIYYKTTVDGMFHLYVDDKCIVSRKNWIVKLQGFDYQIEIGGETLQCVFIEKKLDVAIHGKYIKSQKVYIPNKVLSRYYTGLIIIISTMNVFLFLLLAEKIELTPGKIFGIMFLLCIIMDMCGIYVILWRKKAQKESLIEDIRDEESKINRLDS